MTYTFTAPMRPVNRVFIHCSDSDNPAHDNVKTIRRWHVEERHWSDIGYHLVCTKDGFVHPGRSLEAAPAAQAGHNANTIAICVTGRDEFSDEQFEALRELCHQIHEQLPLATFHGHCEVNPGKTCPNFEYQTVLGLNAKGQLL